MGASRKTIREWVAGELGRKHIVVQSGATASAGTVITLPKIRDIVADNERFEDAFISADIDTDEVLEWRRITAVNVDNGQVVINRAFDDDPASDQEFVIYSLLNPDEWNDAINEELVTLYFEERTEISIDQFRPDLTDQNEFALSSDNVADSDSGVAIGATWLQYKGQVMSVLYRNITTGKETPVTSYKLTEHRNGVSLKLMSKPWSSSTYTLIVTGLRYYPKLNQEDWGTTCPTPLWQAAVVVAVIRKVIAKYGDRFKKQWGMTLQIKEKEYAKMRAAVLPSLIARDYVSDSDWDGPDIDDFFVQPGWV